MPVDETAVVGVGGTLSHDPRAAASKSECERWRVTRLSEAASPAIGGVVGTGILGVKREMKDLNFSLLFLGDFIRLLRRLLVRSISTEEDRDHLDAAGPSISAWQEQPGRREQGENREFISLP